MCRGTCRCGGSHSMKYYWTGSRGFKVQRNISNKTKKWCSNTFQIRSLQVQFSSQAAMRTP